MLLVNYVFSNKSHLFLSFKFFIMFGMEVKMHIIDNV